MDYEADFETNTSLMKQALGNVKTIEICRAVRSTQISGLKIKRKQTISLLDGELVAAGKDAVDVILDTLMKLDLDQHEILTIYYGADTEISEAEATATAVREKYPNVQVETIRGNQPHYNYIVSIE
jgi:dihydroxyacetone kinase-like predicted kinase